VTVIEMCEDIGRDLGPLNKFEMQQKLETHNIEIMKETTFIDFTGDKLIMSMRGKGMRLLESHGHICHRIISKLPPWPGLGRSSWKGDIYRVGDCIAPHRILDAIREGLRIGREI